MWETAASSILKRTKTHGSRTTLWCLPDDRFSNSNRSSNQKRICTHMTTMPNTFMNCKQGWSSNTSVQTYLYFPQLPRFPACTSDSLQMSVWKSMSVVNKSEKRSQRIYIQPCSCVCVCVEPTGHDVEWFRSVCEFLYSTFACALYMKKSWPGMHSYRWMEQLRNLPSQDYWLWRKHGRFPTVPIDLSFMLIPVFTQHSPVTINTGLQTQGNGYVWLINAQPWEKTS